MSLELNHVNEKIKQTGIVITGSKSESNRLLILKELYGNLVLENLSNSKDTKVLIEALQAKNNLINIGDTGTAMRFLTAYFAVKPGLKVVLTGSNRMKNRPVKILVDALTELGADILYLQKTGYPPISINGKLINKYNVKINGSVSSQYITALLLIAPSLKNGLNLHLSGKITSKPYINMTVKLLKKLGIQVEVKKNTIKVLPKLKIENTKIVIESDWSSASYYYGLIALSESGSVTLQTFKKDSLQGDSKLVDIYKQFGVITSFSKNAIILKKVSGYNQKKHLKFNLNDTPDIAQTIAVTCVGLGVSCRISGLKTLKIKETDRLVALKSELQKIGAKVRITEDSIHIKPSDLSLKNINKPVEINTYNDHRMAMAFTPLSIKIPIKINNPEVVNKSYPDFWKDFNKPFN